MSTTTKTRKPWSGFRPTARDMRTVRLIAEQGLVRASDLDSWLAGNPREPISSRTRNAVLARLERGALIERRPWLAGQSSVLAVTDYGARWVDWHGRVGPPAPTLWWHDLAVSRVRINHFEHTNVHWISEQQIILDEVECGLHRPDGLAIIGGQTTAVEVQLSDAGRGHFESVLASHLKHFDHVHYFVNGKDDSFGPLSHQGALDQGAPRGPHRTRITRENKTGTFGSLARAIENFTTAEHVRIQVTEVR